MVPDLANCATTAEQPGRNASWEDCRWCDSCFAWYGCLTEPLRGGRAVGR